MSGLRNVYFAFIFIALGGFLFGYIIGITSNVVTSGQLLCPNDWTGPVGTWTSTGFNQCYELNNLESGLLTSLNLIGACLSSLICFRYGDSLGRKREVQVGALLYMIGAALTAVAPTLWCIYVGLVVYGLGIGFAMHAAPVYIAEISPAEIRGTLVSAKEAVVVLGIFAGFFIGFLFISVETTGWRYMVLISAAFALVMEVGISFIPQSPRFLVLQAVRNSGLLGGGEAKIQEARSALQFFRAASSPETIEAELQTMRNDILQAVGTEPARCTDAFRFRLPLVIGCGLVFLQQVTGQPSVLYFATSIFKDAGLGSSAALSSSLVGLVKLLATLFTVWRVDSYGRRLLLTVGISMMALSLLLIGTAFLFRSCKVEGVSLASCEEADIVLPKGWALSMVAALMLYVSGYQVGFGPISWLMISEVFPVKVRGAALSIAAVVNFSSNILMTLTSKVLQSAITPAGVFYGYFVLCLVSLLFVKLIVPETKGRTLEEIETMLAGRKHSARDVNVDAPALGA